MKQAVVYIPGIQDDIFWAQSILIQSWRLRGIRPVLHAMPWAGEGAFEPKLQELLGVIDRLNDSGYRVSLVGASAGAGAVLHAYAARKVSVYRVVSLCGKVNRADAVSPHTYTANPAFKTSLQLLPGVLAELTKADKAKILSLYSPADTTVPHQDTIIPGVKEEKLAARKHAASIIYTISLGFGRIRSFLHKQ